MIDLYASPIIADVASRVTDGTAPGTVAAGSSMALGGTAGANGNYALLRFDVSTLLAAGIKVWDLELELVVNGAVTPTAAFKVMAANFGATLTEADYSKIAADVLQDKSNAFRVDLKRIAASGVLVADGTRISLPIPTMYLKEADDFLDILIVTEAAGSPGAGGVIAFHGPTAATTGNRPRLTGLAYTRAEGFDPAASARGRCVKTGDAVMSAGIGMETTPGRAVKPDVGLLVNSYNIAPPVGVHTSNAFTRFKSKSVIQAPARVMTNGTMNMDLVIQSWVKLLMSMFTITSTTDLGVIDGTQVYEHVFDLADPCDTKTFTVYSVNGHEHVITPGAVISGMMFDIPTNGLITMGLDFMGLEPFKYDANAGGNAILEYILSSGYSTDIEFAGLSDSQVTQTIDAIAETSIICEGGSISIVRAADPFLGETGMRGATLITPGKPEITGRMSTLFRDEDQCRAYWGVDHYQYPYKVENQIIYQALNLRIAGPLGATKQKIEFQMPKCGYTNIEIDQTEDRSIRASADYEAVVDSTLGGGIRMVCRNSHPASYYAPSTDYIKVLPVGKVAGV